MGNIKLNKFEGIVTAIDENDLNLEVVKDACNIRFEKGFWRTEEYAFTEIDTPDMEHDEGEEGWEWETGIFGIVTTDKLADETIAEQYRILLLVAKREYNGVYYRRVWFKEYPSGSWCTTTIDTARYYDNTYIKIKAAEFLETTLEGQTKLVNEDGVIKIYMPHQSFWFGRIEREIQYSDSDTWTIDQYYFDVLSEEINGLSILNAELLDSTAFNTKRRILLNTEITTDTEASVQSESAYMRFGKVYDFQIWNEGTDQETQGIIVHAYKTKKGSIEFNKLDKSYPGGDTEDFFFFREASGTSWTDYYYIPVEFSTLYTPESTPPSVHYPIVRKDGQQLDWFSDLTGDYKNYYRIHINDILNSKWAIVGGTLADEDGFADSYGYSHIVTTAVLDDTTEVIVSLRRLDLSAIASNWFYKFSLTIDPNINKRVTKIKVYHKLEEITIDYELLKVFDLLDKQNIDLVDVPLGDSSRQGTFLSQNIGFVIDEEKPDLYKTLVAFKDIAKQKGISLAISTYDYSNVYYCTVGGGKVMSDLFYSTNIVRLNELSFVNSLIGVSGKILVGTTKESQAILIQDIDGTPVFEVLDTFAFGGKNFKDIVAIRDNVIINGKYNIYATNGVEKRTIADSIEDRILAFNDTSEIKYNPYMDELYYIPNNFFFGQHFYRYRFNRNVWELFKWNVSYGQYKDLLVDYDGKIAILSNTKLYLGTSGVTTTNTTDTYITFNTSDFGESNVLKNINHIVPDFSGEVLIKFIYPDNTEANFSLNTLTRDWQKVYISLDERKPFPRLYLKIYPSSSTYFYGMEIDFSIAPR